MALMKIISIIVPCYNESANLRPLIERVRPLLTCHSHYVFELILVNDGSTDDTLAVINSLCAGSSWVRGVNLTRNFGKEAALTAGLDHATGDALVFMDADLQHPPEVIGDFIAAWESGSDVVLGRRVSRNTDSAIYRFLATIFYWVHNKISDVPLPQNVGDFRLIDRRVADQLRELRESRRFMKGLFAWVGYSPVCVDYEVEMRIGGVSSFNKWRSWNFALEGITSFSTVPLRVWTYIGAIVMFFGLLYSGLIIVKSMVYGIVTPGYVTLLTAVVVFGGVQLIGIGILGEYIGRIYIEVKRRPAYLVKNILNAALEKKEGNL